MEAGDAAQNGAVLPALTIAALLKEIGEQSIDGLVDMGALRVACQKDPILSGQRAAAAEDFIFLHSQFGQLGSVGRDSGHLAFFVLCAATQGSDLGVQRSKLLQKFFYHSVFLPPGVELQQLDEGGAELTAGYDLVYKAVFQLELTALEALGQALADGLLDDAGACKTDECPARPA